MFDAKVADEQRDRGTGTAIPEARRDKLPVLIILHQLHSTPGHVGHRLAARGHALDIRRPRFGDPLPATLADHAGAVIFGGPMSANDGDDFIRQETEWIAVPLDERKPFLGICLGAQMLARLLGAKVDFHPDGIVEIGYQDICPTAAAARYGPWPDRVYQWHREGFELPAGCTTLATSAGAFEQQAFACGPAAVGVQFHPEMTYAMANRWSGGNPMRLHLRGAQAREAQLVEHLLQGPAVLAWLDRFLGAWLTGADHRIVAAA